MSIYLICKAQIVLLMIEKIIISTKYLDFIDIFSKNLVIELFERVEINKHAISLE